MTRSSLFGAQPNTFGSAQICLQGLLTPDATPDLTFPATSPPTPTPATPTPTPTATAETTALPTPVPTNPVPDPLAPIPDQYTLTYSDGAQGWPSFYSYHPDYMLGMNNPFILFLVVICIDTTQTIQETIFTTNNFLLQLQQYLMKALWKINCLKTYH